MGDAVLAAVRSRSTHLAAIDPHVQPRLRAGIGGTQVMAGSVLRCRSIATGVLNDEIAMQVRDVEPGCLGPVENVVAVDDRVTDGDRDRVLVRARAARYLM